MVTGNPTTATPEDDKNEKVIFDGPGIINSTGQLNVTGTCGALTGVVGTTAGGGGGVGGNGGGFVSVDYNPPGSASWGTTASSVQIDSSIPEVDALKEQVEELKEKLAELEKAENARKDIEYFQRNLHKALKIPEDVKLAWKFKDSSVRVGPNDVLVVYLNVADVPASRVESYMQRAKKGLGAVFEERGLKGRNIWVATRERETGFGAIEISQEANVLGKQDIAEARGILRKKRKYPPPVMG